MITSIQKKAIINHLGKQYGPKIIAWLTKKKVFNSNNEPYKLDSIQKIVNGIENPTVENEIFKLIAKKKKEYQKTLETRKAIIKK